MTEWIPFHHPSDGEVEKKSDNQLPDRDKLVWVFDTFYDGVTIGFYTHNGNPDDGWWVNYTGSDDVGIDYWMPLEYPEAPVVSSD
jgi:hypothetical protein